MDPLLSRILIAAGLILSGLAAYWLANRIKLARLGGRAAGIEAFRSGVPGILYFTTPSCLPCKTIQRPELSRLKERLNGSIQIIEVDCTQKPELASFWGVMSVPTTFVLDANGRPRKINHGVARAEKLQKQLDKLK